MTQVFKKNRECVRRRKTWPSGEEMIQNVKKSWEIFENRPS